ncbi:SMP-30/gluconolactonase/LRE family protein, partial [bacterium]|nr:SMP-30/gluconolactonase/LRE family protein [bacterium]
MKIKLKILSIISILFLFSSIPAFSETVQVQYGYDDLNRLTHVEYTNGAFIEYTYDAAGNRSNRQMALPLDTIPPGIITTLAIAHQLPPSITLNWTAPGNDGYVGTATTYDIRYSTCTITEDNWGFAVQSTGEPAPKPSGANETFTVANLQPNTTYYFAVKTKDDAGLWSGLSNIVSVTTTLPSVQYGSLIITSIPSNAKIYLDGIDTGSVTPQTLTNISPGIHTIKLTLLNYQDWYETAMVTAGSAAYVDTALTQAADGGYEFVCKQPSISWCLDHPLEIAVDSSGDVYVADSNNNRIQKFDSSGGFITTWGSKGNGEGQFNYPSGVAVDSSGNVYVADSNNNRIQKFDYSGSFITTWGSYGNDNGKFDYPHGVAVDSSDNVYVADRNNHRIQKFDSSGIFITTWGSSGSGDDQFDRPCGVAVDPSGNVYVADTGNHRIQKFDSSEAFIATWGSKGTGTGQFGYPCGVTVDSSGNVYVADTGNDRIQKFNPTGIFTAECEGYETNDGQYFYPLSYPHGVAVDLSGNLYVADTKNDRIQKFNPSGDFITKWSNGTDDGQFHYPDEVAVDSSGNVYVADTGNNRIQKFDSSGGFTTKWGCFGSGDGQFNYPRGVIVDSSDNLYVADIDNNRIQKFDSSGNFIIKWGKYGTGDGQFDCPAEVAVDSFGNVYVADYYNNRIQKFNSSGSFITKWGNNGTGDGQFNKPYGIAVDSSDNVYVTDSRNHRIQKFDSGGSFITTWGSEGTGDGQFAYPTGIAVDSFGNVYVADIFNNRIQKFRPSNPLPPAQYGSLSITSFPSGANIFLDGTDTTAGTTPVTLTNISIGTHTVKLIMTGYYDWYETATVTADSTTYVHATLTQAGTFSTTLAVFPEIKTAISGAAFTVQINLSDVPDFDSVGMYLSFDPNVLEVTGLTQGSFPQDGNVIISRFNNDNGTIDYAVGLTS